jgi:hypothetical protein
MPGPQQQAVTIVGQHEAVGLRGQGLDLTGNEVEHLQRARPFLVATAPMGTGNRQGRPDHLATGRTRNLAVAPFGYGEGRDTARQTFGLQRGQGSGLAAGPSPSSSPPFSPFGAGSKGAAPPACSASR